MAANGLEPCHSTQAFSLVVQALEANRKRCPRIKMLLFSSKMQPLTELLLVVQAGPFSLLFGLFFHHPLSHLQQQTTLRYQQLLVNPFPFSTLLQCPYPPSLPPQGVLERSTLSWPRGEKMAEFIPRCVADNTPMCRTSRYRLHTADFPPGVPPRRQHRH